MHWLFRISEKAPGARKAELDMMMKSADVRNSQKSSYIVYTYTHTHTHTTHTQHTHIWEIFKRTLSSVVSIVPSICIWHNMYVTYVYDIYAYLLCLYIHIFTIYAYIYSIYIWIYLLCLSIYAYIYSVYIHKYLVNFSLSLTWEGLFPKKKGCFVCIFSGAERGRLQS